ncbi:hypothetical protein GCM10020331_018410 [Ectobacillus funiculus]
MFERAFVLIPLLEVYDELSYKISPSQLEEMRRQEGVVVWKKKKTRKMYLGFSKAEGCAQC